MPKIASIPPYASARLISKLFTIRGKRRLKTEETEGAIADLDKATSLKPEHAKAPELFGDALLKAGKEVEAAIQWRIAEETQESTFGAGRYDKRWE